MGSSPRTCTSRCWRDTGSAITRTNRSIAGCDRTLGAEAAMENTLAQRFAWTIWPAFLVAAAAETIFFTVFDPSDLYFFGTPLELSRQAMYTLGFFGFWAMGIAS